MKLLRLSPVFILLVLIGCGGSSSPKLIPDFTISTGPSSISLVNNGAAQALSVTVTSVNSFTGSVSITVGGLPGGVTASPATLSLTPGQVGQIMLTASGATVSPSVAVTISGASGTLSHASAATLAITPALSSASLSDTSFDFGQSLVGASVTSSVVTVSNTGTTDITLAPTLSGDASYALVSSGSCGTTLAAGANCTELVSYSPATPSGATAQAATLNLGLTNVAAGTPQTIALTGVSASIPVGTVTATANPQVAQYSVTLPYPGSITVNFGTDTTYGHSTWSQSTDVAGGTINMLVAGMLANTTYHMQANIQLTNGATAKDSDHTFATQAALLNPVVTATTTAGMTPQPGLEELTLLTGNSKNGIAMTDLQGNIVWTYATPDFAKDDIEGVRMLPNGHFLISVGNGSTYGFPTPVEPPVNNIIAAREIDLAGNIIRQITVADLNAELLAAGYTGITLRQFHHEITPLPNGHWLLLSNAEKTFNNLTGIAGPTTVLGDVIVDVDENLQPVWVWNEFDHLDINRHPYSFPDWTHTNAVVYSPSDGNLFVSMRNQNWIVKVAYNDGAGNGDVVWHLGYQGDFTLVGGTDPIDWSYAQHYPALFTANSSGVFSLAAMDNGNDRVGLPNGTPPYSTIPVWQIDETAKTATFTFHQKVDPSLYSFFGGSTEQLPNGNIHYDLCGQGPLVAIGSEIFEVTQTATPATVWHMSITGANAYRALRLPSMYPGVAY